MNMPIQGNVIFNWNLSKLSCRRPNMISRSIQLKAITDSATKMCSRVFQIVKIGCASTDGKIILPAREIQYMKASSIHMPNAHGNNIHMCVYLLPFLLWFLLRVLLCDSDGATANFYEWNLHGNGSMRHLQRTPYLCVCLSSLQWAWKMVSNYIRLWSSAERNDENWMTCQQSQHMMLICYGFCATNELLRTRKTSIL